MAVYKISELRNMNEKELGKKMDELNVAMMEDSGNNPKKNREIRKAIARIKTILNERTDSGESVRFENPEDSQTGKKA